MKKLFFSLLSLVILTAVHAQSDFHMVQKQLAPGQSSRPNYAANNLRSGVNTITINYDSAERYFENVVSGDTVFPTYASGLLNGFYINNHSDTSDYFYINYAIETYDTLINVNNHFAGISHVGATITVDSFSVLLGDSNGTGSSDTLTLSVFDQTAATESGSGLTAAINTTPLWSRSYVDTVNLFGPGTGQYVFNLTFAPNVTLPAGHTFGIRVDFSGNINANINDGLFIAASWGNTCGTGDGVGFASPNPIAPHNSSFYLDYGVASGVYDWNANTPFPGASSQAPCDLIPGQNFYIYPSITIVSDTSTGIAAVGDISNFSIYPNPSNGSFTASIHLAASSDVITTISDVTGNKVYESTNNAVKDLNKAINLGDISAGIYFVNIKTATGTANHRIIVR